VTQSDEVLRLVEDVLGADLVGAYAHGSVELTVVVQSEVRPWRYPPRAELQFGEWMRDELERGDPPGPSPDLAPLLTMVLLADRPLLGPPPAEVLDTVPPDDLRRAIVEGIPGLRADLDTDTRNVLLTFARIWTTLETGEIRSKDAAAAWAIERLPPEHRPVLEHARAVYLDEAPPGWDEPLRARVHPHADYVIARIEALVDREG
jgi:streptomycin 3"-adenylyltransferase